MEGSVSKLDLQAAVDHAPEPIFIKDTALKYLLVNRATAAVAAQLGAQTNWVLPASLRDFSEARARCLPHRKHDIVEALNTPVEANGEPLALLR